MHWVKAIRFKCHVETQNDPDPNKVIEMRHRSDGVMYYAVCNEVRLKIASDLMDPTFDYFLTEQTEMNPVSDEVFLAECKRHVQHWKGELIYNKTEEELNANA